uniref:J domain-containing protein n=1 Tax=Mucochytrium quahogii TaxID=96639 RepID=A0A7S2WI42_9STRA|mmetsp:Transcript_295/g.554  ORF Transcript_295/g.554 Transcript_295/m.554 type:complete len:329 (+) Transcript_295:464-1450(+)|eukprot:CAMPEP_0203748752 /NCGR_PEP_ID=MMETSP0098-20131031/3545_1 /ASSEMBLY_ACC=CAM_ASM_000208 /TAXON_ID=96639 /ORGANISM=" , Strain NY0313808BC1" /LENGTH=328 /DNA_ID=CAMNT_0050637619 /DNA_START=569 /DNA_END=1555 /DNA_ORIENTATION=+
MSTEVLPPKYDSIDLTLDDENEGSSSDATSTPPISYVAEVVDLVEDGDEVVAATCSSEPEAESLSSRKRSRKRKRLESLVPELMKDDHRRRGPTPAEIKELKRQNILRKRAHKNKRRILKPGVKPRPPKSSPKKKKPPILSSDDEESTSVPIPKNTASKFAWHGGQPGCPMLSSRSHDYQGWLHGIRIYNEEMKGMWQRRAEKEQDDLFAAAAAKMAVEMERIRLRKEYERVCELKRREESRRRLLIVCGWDDSVLQLGAGEPYPDPGAKNHYSCLGLLPGTSTADVKARYRKLALMFHPDKNKHKEANEAFCAFSDAYKELTRCTQK